MRFRVVFGIVSDGYKKMRDKYYRAKQFPGWVGPRSHRRGLRSAAQMVTAQGRTVPQMAREATCADSNQQLSRPLWRSRSGLAGTATAQAHVTMPPSISIDLLSGHTPPCELRRHRVMNRPGLSLGP